MKVTFLHWKQSIQIREQSIQYSTESEYLRERNILKYL